MELHYQTQGATSLKLLFRIRSLVRNLAWHGVRASKQILHPGDENAAQTLLSAAQERAGLLVMGGYGHSRIREWVFGGFTQRVLENAPLHILLAH